MRHNGILALVVLLLTGCGFLPPPKAQADAITFMVFGDPAEKAAYEQLVAAFAKRSPDITVTLQHIPSQSDYRTRLAADMAAGTPADVVLINYRRYAAFAAKGTLEPLGPYLDKSELISADAFYPTAMEPFFWEGTLMCIPQNISSLVVYYNRNLFDAAGVAYPQAGWSWDDFLAAAKALTRDTDGDGSVDQHGLGTEVELIRAAPFIWQRGGEIVDNPAAPTRLTLTDPVALEALQWFVDLQVKHHVVPDATQEEAEDSESRFINGRLGMLLNSRRGVPTYREVTSFTWDVAPLPQAGQPVTMLHADAYCLPAASQHKDAAWRFIEFANASEGQAIIAATGRTVPSLRAVAESPAFLDPNVAPANSQVWLDIVDTVRGVPVLPQWAEIEELAGAELTRAYYGQASLEEAMDAAERNTQVFFAP